MTPLKAKLEANPNRVTMPPAGTRFKAGRRPAAEASIYNVLYYICEYIYNM